MQAMQVGNHPKNSKPFDDTNNVEGTIFTVHVQPMGRTFKASARLSLLEGAELAAQPGLQLASSCRNGTCRTCICRLQSGKVIYYIKWPGLSLDEKRDGFILPCVAYPASDVVIELLS